MSLGCRLRSNEKKSKGIIIKSAGGLRDPAANLHKAKRIKKKTRQFSVAPVPSGFPPPADLSPCPPSFSPPPTLPLLPSPNRSREEEPPPTGVGPRNRKCPLARRQQPNVTIPLCCASPVTAPPCGHMRVFNAVRQSACFREKLVFCLKQKQQFCLEPQCRPIRSRETKAGTGSTETWKVRFLLNVAPEHEANTTPAAEDDVCGGKNPEMKNKKSIVFFSQLWLSLQDMKLNKQNIFYV